MHNRENEQLIYHYEVLRARLDIRDFFMKNIVREVYENIGQVLSLVRLQLSFVDSEKTEMPMDNIVSSGKLVGQSIRDLRSMCNSFYPDNDIIKEGGFITGLESSIKIIFPDNHVKIKTKGIPKQSANGDQLILFKIMLDLLVSIKNSGGLYNNTTINYQEDIVTFTLSFKGRELDSGMETSCDGIEPILSFAERLDLIKTKSCTRASKTGLNQIILKVPVNINYYE